MLQLDEAAGPDLLSRLTALGLSEPRQPDFGGGVWIAEAAGDSAAALRVLDSARALPGVISAEPLLARQQDKKLIPNDPLFGQQWHLRNTGQGNGVVGADARITSVWDTLQGDAVVIGIIDDGVQLVHPDLAPNATPSWHYDWNGNDTNPAPIQQNEDWHGTAVAGVAAARGGNNIGVSGAAPLAGIVGLRLIAEPADDAEEAAAFAHENQNIHIKNNSWGPSDNGRVLGYIGVLAKAALAQSAALGRGGKGTLHTWAGGNGRQNQDQSNKDAYANDIHVIAVGATTNRDTQAPYSENGANLVVSAPSNGGTRAVVTTDMVGDDGYNDGVTSTEIGNRDYTNGFGGTSSATPMVSGVIALMLEVNPDLGWRDVKEVLLRSSRVILPASPGWVSRYGGRPDLPRIKHHESFGGGVVDAAKAVELAATWDVLPALTEFHEITVTPNLAIPDRTGSVEQVFDFSTLDSLRVEHVEVEVDIPHQYRGDLEILLVSPNGVTSTLAAVSALDLGIDPATSQPGQGYEPWTFTSVRHWGEGSQGIWKVIVSDKLRGDKGTWKSATVRLHGIPSVPVQLVSHTDRLFAIEGQPATLSASATGDPMIHFEWSNNDKFAAEVLEEDWTRTAMKLTDAGNHRVTAVNSTGTETSPVIPVHVLRVDTTPVGVAVNKTLTLKAVASGPGPLQYRWQRDGADLVEGIDATGTDKPQLVIKNISPGQGGEFECLVFDGVEEKSSGVRVVSVIEPPLMEDLLGNDKTIVSGTPFYQFTAEHGATRFEARGVPPGMKFNVRTGELSGRPNRAGTFTIRVRARNVAGVSPWREYNIVVDPLPNHVAGMFRGIIEPDEIVNRSTGGSVEVKIGPTGTFTGRIGLLFGIYSFRGRLDAVPDDDTPTITILITRRNLPPLELLIKAESASQRCTGTLKIDADEAAWRAEMDFWHQRNQPATSRAGYHTVLMKHNDTPATGAGFAGVTVTSGGAVRLAGRAPDTMALTQSRVLSRTGEVPVFALLDKKRAALCGWLTVNEGTEPDFSDGTVTGTLAWKRLDNLTGTRFHPEGFELALDTQGGRHPRPDSGDVLMGLPDPSSVPGGVNAMITLSGASIAGAAMAPDVTALGFSLTTRHKAVFPPAGSTGNQARVKLSLNPRTGVGKGSADFRDPNPSGGNPLRRLVTFHTIVSGSVAEGCLIIADLPVPPESLKDTPTRSGSIKIEAF